MNNNSLITGLNQIRELSSELYQRNVPVISDTDSIEVFSSAILNNPVVQNEFISNLVNKFAYSQTETKLFNNKLKILEGDDIPLGYVGEEIYINPAVGRKFNVNDFAGILAKYESDVKVQYMKLNLDEQYPVSVSRDKLREAFSSWGNLKSFINSITTSLYNGAYIDMYSYTKALVSNAYRTNQGIIKQITAPTTQATAEAFVKEARALFLNFSEPESQYNSWAKIGGYGLPIITWCDPEDVVFIIRNDILSEIDVSSLAKAMNIDKAKLLGNVIGVNNFNILNDKRQVIYNADKILGIMSDKKWFRIKQKDMFLEDDYNPNNRVRQFFLNVEKMYQYSLFANHVIFATETPTIKTESLNYDAYGNDGVSVNVDGTIAVKVAVNPITSTDNITYTQSNGSDSIFSIDEGSSKSEILITGIANGTGTITARSNNKTATLTVTVGTGVEEIESNTP